MMKSSEALQIMDHNTELYMIDQMRQENSQLQKKILEEKKQTQIEKKQAKKKIDQLQKENELLRSQLQQKDSKPADS